MLGENIRDWYSQGKIFVLGCLSGTAISLAVGVFILSPGINSSGVVEVPFGSTANSTADSTTNVLDAEPRYSLRLIQAIGILLPLFTGLLRFTTDDQSAVNEDVSDYLLLGILGLVLGGVFASVGGIAADTAVILKSSLIVVAFAFTLIGFAAMVMLREMTASTNQSDETRTDPIDAEEREKEENRVDDVSDVTDEPETEGEATETETKPDETDGDME
jgi:large-conductance mechanosensitive channel